MKQGLAMTEVATKGAELWRAVSEGEKAKWDKKAAAAKVKNEKEVAKYEKSAVYKQYVAEKAAFEASIKHTKDAEKAAKKEASAKKKVKEMSQKKVAKRSRSRSRSRSKSTGRKAA